MKIYYFTKQLSLCSEENRQHISKYLNNKSLLSSYFNSYSNNYLTSLTSKILRELTSFSEYKKLVNYSDNKGERI